MTSYDFVEKVLQVNELANEFYNSNPAHAQKLDLRHPDLQHLINSLEKYQVRYILIGGFAMAFYGHVRATNDLDLWIRNDPANMKNLREALIDAGYTEAKALQATTQLVPGMAIFNMLESGFKLDLMHFLKAFREVDFDACYNRASNSTFRGTTLKVLAAQDMPVEKQSVNREKDLTDISFLKNLIG